MKVTFTLACLAAFPCLAELGKDYDASWKSIEVSIRSTADGTMQPAFFYVPEAIRGRRMPLIVALHTWSYGHTAVGSGVWAVQAADRYGWAMIYPHFRGPNKRPEACGSDLAVQDIVDAIAWAKAHAEIDGDRVYIAGGSGGGHMTLLMAGRHPELFAAAYAACPITDLAAWYRESPNVGCEYWRHLEAVCGGTPEARPDEYGRRSPLTYLEAARRARLPVRIETGIHDGHSGNSVPISHAFNAFNLLADEKDRFSRFDVNAMMETQKVENPALRYRGSDPFFPGNRAVLIRRQSANALITLFNAGHAGNFEAAAWWLNRQRKGRAADWTLFEKDVHPAGRSEAVAR